MPIPFLSAIAWPKVLKWGIVLAAIIAVSTTVRSCSENQAELLSQIERLATEKAMMEATLKAEEDANTALEEALTIAKTNAAASSKAVTELEERFAEAQAEAERQKKLFADYKALQSAANADMEGTQQESNRVTKERQDELANLFNTP